MLPILPDEKPEFESQRCSARAASAAAVKAGAAVHPDGHVRQALRHAKALGSMAARGQRPTPQSVLILLQRPDQLTRPNPKTLRLTSLPSLCSVTGSSQLLPPKSKGCYKFTCAAGVWRGLVRFALVMRGKDAGGQNGRPQIAAPPRMSLTTLSEHAVLSAWRYAPEGSQIQRVAGPFEQPCESVNFVY